MAEKVDEMGGGGVMGFQLPLGVKARKEALDKVLKKHDDLDEGMMLHFLRQVNGQALDNLFRVLDAGAYDQAADMVREHIIREVVRSKVKTKLPEVVRKKGDTYVLYAPNRGKKGKSRSVGTFPTKLGAKRAELARFPPRDEYKLKRLRREINRLQKDPNARKEAEKRAKRDAAAPKKESFDADRFAPMAKTPDIEPIRGHSPMDQMERKILAVIVKEGLLRESLFGEEKSGSDWDKYIGKLSKNAMLDKKLQSLQKGIEKKTAQVLENALADIKKAVGKEVKLKNFGVKKNDEGKTYLAFGASFSNATVEPIYIHVQDGVPKIELSQNAKVSLTKVDPQEGKLFRAELVTVQEQVLDEVQDLVKAIQARDKYLEKVQSKVDDYVSQLDPLALGLLRQLVVKKYKK